MQFQVLDVDYVLVNEKPVIRVFGKDEKGDTVCGFYEGFQPYFYATGTGIEDKLKDNPQVVKIEKVKRTLPIGYQEPSEVYKITLRNPAKTVEVRENLRAGGIVPYEADILFKYRWMNDIGIGAMRWIDTQGSNGISTDSVYADRKIQMKDVKVVEKNDNAPLKYLALDIETVSDDMSKMPVASKDPIVMISLVFKPGYREKESIVLSTRHCDGVEPSNSEKDMLKRFVEIINEYDPDVITGYNINGFDIPYILERMQRNSVRPIFGRCKTKRVRADKFANRYRVSIVGRIIADSFQIIKKGWNLKRYGLDFVGKELIGEEKEDVKKSEIGPLWRGSPADVSRLAKYCLQDSELAMNLLLKLKLMDKFVALSKISGSVLNDILGGGEIQRIENYLLREFNKEGYILPSKKERTFVAKGVKREGLKGGFVLEPKKGLHSMVLVLDFKSMYPSLIRTYNICPTTLVTDGRDEDVTSTPLGAKFVKKEVRYGIMPRILENLMLERGKVKKRMKDANEDVKARLNMEQLALKLMSNAFYGYFGYSRAKIHSLEIAGAITSLGRKTIQETVKMVEGEFGHEVVYGDTDSVMVKVKTDSLDEAERIGKDLSEKVTKRLPGIMELEFEKTLKRFLPLTKKRYMAWSMERGKDGKWKEGIIMKGIETVRRDWCELTSDTMRKIIDIILKHNDVKEAVKYFKGVVDSLLEGSIDIEKLVITKSITKKPEDYVGVQPHVEVVKKMRGRNVLDMPGVGDRIGYVIVKGTQMLSKRAEDPAYVTEKGIKLDSSYYINNQLLPPLERIFSAIGVDKQELFGMGKQLGIADAINNHNNGHEKKEPVIASISDVNGFICRKCSRSYRRPPLIGRCECGGSFQFSSTAGPADRIRLS